MAIGPLPHFRTAWFVPGEEYRRPGLGGDDVWVVVLPDGTKAEVTGWQG